MSDYPTPQEREFHRAAAEEKWELARSARLENDELQRRLQLETYSPYRRRIYVFSEPVLPHTVGRLYDNVSTWAYANPGELITIEITSPGGALYDGIGLVDKILALRNEGARINTVCRGIAASAAACIFMAGEERIIGANSTLMMHRASAEVGGTLDQIQDAVDLIQVSQRAMDKLIAERSSLTLKQVQQKMNRADWSVGAEEAVALKLADRIG